MLFVYNEMKTPWEMTQNKSYLTLRKFIDAPTPLTKGKLKPGQRKMTRRTSSILLNKAVAEDPTAIQNQIKTLTNMKSVEKIDLAATTVLFASRTFSPIMMPLQTETPQPARDEKHLFAVSLYVGRKRIISIKTENAYLLNHSAHGDEFAFLASLNRPNARITIRLIDTKNKKVTRRKFKYDGTQLVELPATITPATVEQLTNRYTIRRFRPARATQVVFHRPEENVASHNALGRDDASRHIIIEVKSADHLIDEIRALKEKKYEAVTLYVPSFRKSDKTLASYTDTLNKHFHIVHQLDEKQQITKMY